MSGGLSRGRLTLWSETGLRYYLPEEHRPATPEGSLQGRLGLTRGIPISRLLQSRFTLGVLHEGPFRPGPAHVRVAEAFGPHARCAVHVAYGASWSVSSPGSFKVPLEQVRLPFTGLPMPPGLARVPDQDSCIGPASRPLVGPSGRRHQGRVRTS